MDELRADLHCHTTYSDGSSTPEQLIQHAAKIGLKGLSITDHDTIGAYPEAFQLAKQHNITIIPGVEFSTNHRTNPVHILGYSFDPTDKALLAFCEGHQKRREQRNQAILDRLAALGLPVTVEDFPASQGSIGRPHIAAGMVKRGYVDSIQDAFKKYLREGGSAYVAGPRFTVEETIDVIHAARGLAVIAHPHLVSDDATIKHLLTLKFDGIEVFYARFPRDRCDKWLNIANQKNWLVTGGSDFHGDAKPSIALGASWAPPATFQHLVDHYHGVVGE
ncbi:MAG: PHP domain-containing protein [Chlamydiales bacterium]|nr:PHP domain-containing protein [Chlamydiales bacterium]